MRTKRVMRFVGNRPTPEDKLYNRTDEVMEANFGFYWGEKIPKSMSLPDLREFSKTCPNPLDSDFPKQEADKGAIVLPKNISLIEAYIAASSGYGYPWSQPMWGDTLPSQAKPEEQRFEVNLTEPLVGWRAWRFCTPHESIKIGLRSLNSHMLWRPGEILKGICTTGAGRYISIVNGVEDKSPHAHENVPREHCTCGIYAVDNRDAVPVPEDKANIVEGLVYGWGRYVRGDKGWRCQFAYPKEFHLRADQMGMIDYLKAFHIPIYVEQAVQFYDPKDEGYTNANWENDQDRDLGTATDSPAEENENWDDEE